MKTLVSLFLQSIAKFDAQVAYKMKPRWRTISWTYRQLGNFASGIARDLQALGVEHGDRVILISPNMPHWPGSFFGALLRGAILIPLNPQSTREFVQKIIQQTDAKVILKFSGLQLGDLGIPVIDIDVCDSYTKQPAVYTQIPVQESDVAEIVYTSGTTGDPKGVVLTHKNIVSNIEAILKVFTMDKGDTTVSVLPLFHMFDQTTEMSLALLSGVCVMYASSLSARAIQQSMQAQRATKMAMVPEMLETIMRRIEQRAQDGIKGKFLSFCFSIAPYMPYWARRILFHPVLKNFGGRLHLIVSGGAALPIDIEKRWNLLGIQVLQGYGLTETSPVVSTNTLTEHKFGSVGKVVDSVKVDIGRDGEILVHGESVFHEYYKDPVRTKEAFDEQGRYKTGDLGHFDEDKFLFISGRKKYVIIGPSGENVYPEDIESVLKGIPGVIDAAVIGVEHHGREVVHAVLLGDIAHPKQVIAQANKQLAPYQHIIDWSIWPQPDFPRSATRKVRKEEVKKWLHEQHGQAAHAARPKQAITPLMQIVAAVSSVPVNEIHDGTNLMSDLHLDSLMRIELVSAIEERLNVTLDEHAITADTTMADLAKLIETTPATTKQKTVRTWLCSWPLVWLRFLLQYVLVFPLYLWRLRIRVEGIEYVEQLTEPALFMPNHISFIDTVLVLWALPRRIRRRVAIAAALDFLYKKYWWAAWFIGFLFNTYPFPRKETENIKPGLEATGLLLDKGFNILVFPEGKISDDGTLQPLKQGAGLLATQMQAPVVPMALKGVRDIVGPEQLFPRLGTVTVCFGAPLVFDVRTSHVEATQRIEEAMRAL